MRGDIRTCRTWLALIDELKYWKEKDSELATWCHSDWQVILPCNEE